MLIFQCVRKKKENYKNMMIIMHRTNMASLQITHGLVYEGKKADKKPPRLRKCFLLPQHTMHTQPMSKSRISNIVLLEQPPHSSSALS